MLSRISRRASMVLSTGCREAAAPLRGGGKRQAAGFTLIELLMVIMIIGILLGMVSGGILYAVKNARNNRNKTTRLTLRTAAQTYRHEYGDWPYNKSDVRTFGSGDDAFEGVRYDEKNYEVFNRLLAEHSGNTKKIVFLEPGRFIAEDTDGERVRWADCLKGGTSAKCPLINPWGRPYEVTINFDADTISIE